MGCRRVAPQPELVRIVRSGDGRLVVSRTAPGRGAWLCAASSACIDAALRRKAFGRALRADVSRAAVEALRAELHS